MPANVDKNQPDVVKWFRERGAVVDYTYTVGHGFPDLVVSYRGLVVLVEVKSGHHQLNERQKEWHALHQGHAKLVVRTEQDVTKVIHHLDRIVDIISNSNITLEEVLNDRCD